MYSQSVIINSDSLLDIQNRIVEQQVSIDSLTTVITNYGVFDTIDGVFTFGGLVVILSIWRYLSQFKGVDHNRYMRK
jgi:hypothetical protein